LIVQVNHGPGEQSKTFLMTERSRILENSGCTWRLGDR
jgi:hypothetical protein